MASSALDQLEDYLRRVLRVGTVLVDMHLDVARQEASYESRRLIGGVVMVGIGIGLMATAAVLAQVAGIIFAQACGLTWWQAVGAVAATNLVLGLLFLVLGRLQLRGPVMTQTQARLARSLALLQAKE
ncbi:phage holin family protein [Nodosilinea sp. LEGE 07088]|uniref:phage holin family protein n=1 Tax=Nodosilinea sp. LEGE 07088 TaxID=2777968 RepID=UPI00187E3486|nr:phage holin family protein [Nodosilinea sp. LEGE 07088]MBE9140419.1 phage holin family protein [Nodosilinea sp. LEGE 07088]